MSWREVGEGGLRLMVEFIIWVVHERRRVELKGFELLMKE